MITESFEAAPLERKARSRATYRKSSISIETIMKTPEHTGHARFPRNAVEPRPLSRKCVGKYPLKCARLARVR